MSLDLDKFVADIKPSVSEVEQYDVTFETGFLKSLNDRFVHCVNNKIELAGGKLCFDSDEFTKYLDTLLRARVELARSEKSTIPRGVLKNFNIPAVHQLALNKIGWVQDEDTKEVFVPKLGSPHEMTFLSVQEMVSFSSKLGLLTDFGVEVNPGLNLDREGDLSFMTWEVVSGKVKEYYRERKNGPASDAILLSFFNIQQVDQIIRKRFYYGNSSYYETILDALFVDLCRK